MSKNKEIAEIFSKMADIMEFLEENPYRINTYRRVAEVLSELEWIRLAYEKLNVRTKDDLLRAVRSGMLATFPGIREKKLQNIMRGLELYESMSTF
jgi:DNA polymerase (family 10)